MAYWLEIAAITGGWAGVVVAAMTLQNAKRAALLREIRERLDRLDTAGGAHVRGLQVRLDDLEHRVDRNTDRLDRFIEGRRQPEGC